MAEELEEVTAPEQEEATDDRPQKIQVNGRYYDSLEAAIAAVDQASKNTDQRNRDLAEERKELQRLRDEFEERRQQAQQPKPDEASPFDPETTQNLRTFLQREFATRDAYLRDLNNRLVALDVQSAGVNLEEVRERVRKKYAHKPVQMNMILNDRDLLQEQQQLMEMERNADDLAELRRRKEATKQRMTTETGAAGAGSKGPKVPTMAEIKAMNPTKRDEFDRKFMTDPDYRRAVIAQNG